MSMQIKRLQQNSCLMCSCVCADSLASVLGHRPLFSPGRRERSDLRGLELAK